MSYAPNLAARALAARRSGLVGIVVATLVDPSGAAVVGVLERELRLAGYASILAVTNGGESALPLFREALGRGVEALISWDVPAAPDLTEGLAAEGIPWLAFGVRANSGDLPLGAATGRGGGAILACRYLRSLGHHRIGSIARPGSEVVAALRAALAGSAASLEVAPLAIVGEFEAAQAAASALLDRPNAPEAIICDSDVSAAAVLREARARRIAVPEQLSVVGCGDSPLARATTPLLTSVRVAAADLAALAVAWLRRGPGASPGPSREPSAKLVIRESTAPAPA